MSVHKIKEILPGVFEVPTYKETDDEFGFGAYDNRYDLWARGGCSCMAKEIAPGELILGRNLDLTMSNRVSYIIRVDEPGKYKTIGLAYCNQDVLTYDQIKELGGLDDYTYKMLPYLCADVMNEHGFYAEINMRCDEYDEEGNSVFSCSSTNPGAEIRVAGIPLARALADRCKTVEEAIEALKQIDIYTPTPKSGMGWNFALMIGDATGDYALVELALNKVSILRKQPGQTNFYVTPEFAKFEKYVVGKGRYESMMARYDGIKTEKDMFEALDEVTYLQSYTLESKYDQRTEFCAVEPDWTYDFVMAPENQETVAKRILKNKAEIEKLYAEGKLLDANKYWMSIFTNVANCKNKTMTVRFYEDNSIVAHIGFDK